MHNLVGIIRVEAELQQALEKLAVLKQRAARVHVDGGRVYNPGWHVAMALASLLTVSECCALAQGEPGRPPPRGPPVPRRHLGGGQSGLPAAGRPDRSAARAAAPDASRAEGPRPGEAGVAKTVTTRVARGDA